MSLDFDRVSKATFRPPSDQNFLTKLEIPFEKYWEEKGSNQGLLPSVVCPLVPTTNRAFI